MMSRFLERSFRCDEERDLDETEHWVVDRVVDVAPLNQDRQYSSTPMGWVRSSLGLLTRRSSTTLKASSGMSSARYPE
jgi:hypothetical protein